MRKNLLALGLCAAMLAGAAAGCGNNTNSNAGETGTPTAKGAVYYLNFKPEQADQWTALAKAYTDETGVPVTVVTAASGGYEQQLKSEMAKSEAPTLFQVNGPVGLAAWKDYCYDLSGSDVVSELTSDSFALKNGDQIAGVAYVTETYGLIYNEELLNKYCELDNAKIKNASEINNFSTLKVVAEDIQARRDELGVKGAFTSAGMDSSSDWRFKTHLANIPVYYEYRDRGLSTTDAIEGKYLDNYRAVWDLYIENATCAPALLSSKTGDDAAAEFAMGEAVFYQNGTWAWNDITGYEVEDDDIGMMPIYIGVPGEENQGLCTGSENYWCVNKKAKDEDIMATLDFLSWCVTSDKGKTALTDMGFVCPFRGFTDQYAPDNPLLEAAREDIEVGHTPVDWCFTTMPSETWKNGVGAALLEYAQGTGKWDAVQTAFVDGWKTEYQASNPAA